MHQLAALIYFIKRLMEKHEEKTNLNLGKKYLKIAQEHFKMKNYNKASELLLESIHHFDIAQHTLTRKNKPYKEMITAKEYLGHSYMQLGNLKEAYLAYTDGGNICIEMKKYEKALELFENALLTNYNASEAYYNIGRTYMLLNKFEEAEKSFKNSVYKDPHFALGHYGLCYIYYIEGEEELLFQELKILKELDPELANNLFHNIYGKE